MASLLERYQKAMKQQADSATELTAIREECAKMLGVLSVQTNQISLEKLVDIAGRVK